jgi:hypothetical protein
MKARGVCFPQLFPWGNKEALPSTLFHNREANRGFYHISSCSIVSKQSCPQHSFLDLSFLCWIVCVMFGFTSSLCVGAGLLYATYCMVMLSGSTSCMWHGKKQTVNYTALAGAYTQHFCVAVASLIKRVGTERGHQPEMNPYPTPPGPGPGQGQFRAQSSSFYKQNTIQNVPCTSGLQFKNACT